MTEMPEAGSPLPTRTRAPEVGMPRDHEALTQEKQDVLEAIKSGEDKEGAIVFATFKKALVDGEPFDQLSRTFRAARNSAAEFTATGSSREAEKLLVSIRTLYGQVGLGEYTIQIDPSEGASQADKDQLAQQKLLDDFDALQDTIVERRYIGGYVDARAEVNLGQKKLEALVGGKVSREAIRVAAYAQAGKEARLMGVEASALALGDKEAEKNLIDARIDRRAAPREAYVGLNKRGSEKIEEGIAKGADDLGLAGQKLDGGDRNAVRRNLAYRHENLQQRINHSREELAKTIRTADPERICKETADIKSMEQEAKRLQSEAKVALAYYKAEDSVAGFSKARGELVDKLLADGIDVEGIKEKVARFWQASKAIVSTHWNSIKENVRHTVEPYVDSLNETLASVSEGVTKVVNTVNEQFVGRIKNLFEKRQEQINQRRLDSEDGAKRKIAEAERKKIDARADYLQKRHNLKVDKNRAVEAISLELQTAGSHLLIESTRLLGVTKEQKARFSEKHRQVEAQRNNLATRLDAKARSLKSQDAYLAEGLAALRRHVKEPENPAPSDHVSDSQPDVDVASPAASEPSKEGAGEAPKKKEKKSEVKPTSLREVLQAGGVFFNVLWDGHNVTVQRGDNEIRVVRRAKNVNEARAAFDEVVSQLNLLGKDRGWKVQRNATLPDEAEKIQPKPKSNTAEESNDEKGVDAESVLERQIAESGQNFREAQAEMLEDNGSRRARDGLRTAVEEYYTRMKQLRTFLNTRLPVPGINGNGSVPEQLRSYSEVNRLLDELDAGMKLLDDDDLANRSGLVQSYGNALGQLRQSYTDAGGGKK